VRIKKYPNREEKHVFLQNKISICQEWLAFILP